MSHVTMDESNDKCNWKKVFKKFLEPQKLAETENAQLNNSEKSISVGSFVNYEKSVSESSLISCSPASNDSGYSGCKLEFYSKLPSETHITFETNQNFPQTNDFKPLFNNESILNPPYNYELNMNVPNTDKLHGCKTEFYNVLSSKKLPSHEFVKNTPQRGCKPEFNLKLPSKLPSHDLNVDISHTRDIPESKTTENIHGKVPEWKKAFKNILSDSTSVVDVPYQKDSNPLKKTGNFKNSDTQGITSQRKQSSSKPKKRYEKAEKYKDYEISEAEKKVKEIFALSRMFKNEKVNINDFQGCGVDIFKHDNSSINKSTYGSSNHIDKPYLPLTGFIAKSKPYTAVDVAASYVPFEEDAWDDDLLI